MALMTDDTCSFFVYYGFLTADLIGLHIFYQIGSKRNQVLKKSKIKEQYSVFMHVLLVKVNVLYTPIYCALHILLAWVYYH